MTRRLAALAALALLVPAPAASAHGGAAAAVDFRSRVLAVPPGVAVRVVGGDDRLLVRRTGAATVLVRGYEGEPFLRLDAEGVWRNDASLAARLSGSRYGAPAAVGDGDPNAPPRWTRIGRGRSVEYHDHRIHWMASQLPSAVRGARATPRLIERWSVPVEVGGRAGVISGRLDYVPPPRALAWWAVVLAALALGGVAGWRSGLRGARVGLGVGVAAATVIAVGAALDGADGWAGAPAAAAATVVPALLAVGIGWRLRRVAVQEVTVLALGALVAIGVPLGARLAPSLAHGVLPSGLPATGVRLLLMLAAAALAAVLAAALRTWRDALSQTTASTPRSGTASQSRTSNGASPPARSAQASRKTSRTTS